MDDISNDFYTDNNENEFYEDEDDEEEFENNSLNGRLSVNNFQNINEDSSASMLLESKPRKRKSSIDLSKYCKKRKCRTTFSKDQLDELEKEFTNSNFISNDRVDLMIELTGLDSRIIKNWFKNKRSRVLADTKSGTKTQLDLPQVLTNSPSLNNKPELRQTPFISNACYKPQTQQQQYHQSYSSLQPLTKPQLFPQQQLFVQTSNLNPNSKENQINNHMLHYLSHKCNQSNQNSNGNLNHNQEPSGLHVNNLMFNKESSLLSQSYPMLLTSQKTSNIKYIEHSTDRSSYNRNPNGLLNIIKSSDTIDKESNFSNGAKLIKPTIANHEIETKSQTTELKSGLCTACLKVSNLFCTCNVSIQAITKLYSNTNRFSFMNNFNDCVSAHLQFNDNSMNSGKSHQKNDPQRFDINKHTEKCESYLSYDSGKLNDLNLSGIDFEKTFEVL